MNGTTATEAAALQWLADRGVSVVEAIPVETAEGAVAAARRIGYPVVLKINDGVTTHKTDVGGVVVGLGSDHQVEAAIRRLQVGGFDSFLVERELKGVEVLVGAVRDPSLGPFVVVGWGGTLAELVGSPAMAVAPVTTEEADALLRETAVSRLIDGWRGGRPANRRALCELVSLVSWIISDHPEIAELDLNPVIVDDDGAVAVDAAMVWRRDTTRQTEPGPDGFPDLDRLFNPRSIAIVGASRDQYKPGGRVMRYLQSHGFLGDIHPVNSRSTDGLGPLAVTSITQLAGKDIDLACIAVSADNVPAVLDDCERIGLGHAVIFSAGFGEAGRTGADLQKRLGKGEPGGRSIRFVGPNSNGIASFHNNTVASIAMTFELHGCPPGSISLVTQSGAIGSSLVGRGWDVGMGFSRWVSTGNEDDLDLADYIAHLATDGETRVVLLFLEVIRRPEALAAALKRCHENGVVVVAWKIGRSEAARRAALSHTGAMIGDERAYATWLDHHRVIRVGGMDDLLGAGQVVARYGGSAGGRVGVVTMSGGASALVADECSEMGLDLPMLSERTRRELEKVIPGYAHVDNPLDVSASAITSPEILLASTEIFLADEGIDLVIVQFTTNADPTASEMAQTLVGFAKRFSKPLLVSRLGSPRLAPEATKVYEGAGMPVFDSPRGVVAAASVLVRAGRNLNDRAWGRE